jgi:predicted amino acid racemase
VPQLRVDVEAIGKNAESVAALLGAQGLNLVAVTKGCLGEPRVAAAMLAGGAVALADTRGPNLRRLRTALPRAELHRIHLPSLIEPFELGDVTYLSSLEGAAAVARAGALVPRSGRRPQRVMVQVETGDEREGAPLEDLQALVSGIQADPRLRFDGISTNYACFKGTPDGIRRSVESLAAAADALRESGQRADRVSGGNSSLLGFLAAGEQLPHQVTELRCGEALLLGREALFSQPLPGCRTDACKVRAEVVEEYTRRAAAGPARRLVLDIGRQDLGAGAVRFLEPGLVEIGRSADYLVVEARRECGRLTVGAMIDMIPTYEALVAAWTSPYVELTFPMGS